jgi:elongation factor G
MKVYDAASIRNVAVVGHGGSGKTQLVSALLLDAGMVNRLGKVDEGNTVTDYDEEEISRKHTLSASLAYAEWNKTKINFIDIPGFGNNFSDARAALHVADGAVVVVDGVSGVEVQTEKAWAVCEELKLPRVIAVNRLDRDRASIDRALESLRATLGRSIVPIQLPIGDEKDFVGVVDVVSMKAYTFATDGTGKMTEGPVPAGMTAATNAAREALIEMVAEADESLMEKFFEAGTLTQEELVRGLAGATREVKLVPLVCTSGLQNIGGQPLMDAILSYLPSPAERPFTALTNQEAVTRTANDSAPYAAFVWKTVADQFAGRITMFRVYQGCLKADSSIHNATQGTQERLGHLIVMQGKTPANVPEIKAGDIGAVAKLKDTRTNDTIADKTAGITFAPIPFPEPVLSYAIEPKSRGDEDKISTAMHRLEEEDGTIKYQRDPQTHELLLAGQGQMHIEVTVAKLKRRFGVEVNLKPPRIPYRETITARVEAHGRHKKQTGGHGQFGDCKIKMEPLPRGSEFEFVDEIFGGAIPAVEKGIQESRLRGYLAGYPVVDFRVTLYDGSYHDVDSNELSFKTAGWLAFKDGMSRAKPTLLEPIMNVTVQAPSDNAGDLMGDLNGRRGRISGMEARGQSTIIKAQVPMAEMLTYEQHLTSVTGGRGSYHMEYSHYDEVPNHLQTKIVATAKAERGQVVEEPA